MRQTQLQTYRERVGGARGGVLQIGFDYSLNLPYYNGTVEEIIAVNSAGMLALHRRGDLVTVQHDRCGMATRGGAQSSAAWRSPAVRRTRAFTGSQGGVWQHRLTRVQREHAGGVDGNDLFGGTVVAGFKAGAEADLQHAPHARRRPRARGRFAAGIAASTDA